MTNLNVIYFINENKLIDNMRVQNKNNIFIHLKQNYADLSGMLYNCTSFTLINLSNISTNDVTDIHCMFQNCYLLTSINLSNFNTNKVINMKCLFNNCRSCPLLTYLILIQII